MEMKDMRSKVTNAARHALRFFVARGGQMQVDGPAGIRAAGIASETVTELRAAGYIEPEASGYSITRNGRAELERSS
jgi:hypothetical protein